MLDVGVFTNMRFTAGSLSVTFAFFALFGFIFMVTQYFQFVRGYDTTLIADAHTTEDLSDYGLPPADKVIAHTNMYWKWQDAPDRVATVVPAADVDFGDRVATS